jgi:L-alanine-DL-glutamate epimerase-like enolase superfamily enzyme
LTARLPAGSALARIEAFVFREPLETYVRTSFGVMRDRPALFVRVEDQEGALGWGEVWCNFPEHGAEHRARLIGAVFAPLLQSMPIDRPSEVFAELTARTAVLAIQTGEHGPIHQCIAGIDIALWDLAARRQGQPLWRFMGGTDPVIRAYASGINPDGAAETALRCRAEGHRAFKLKVGFGRDKDLANLRAMRDALGMDCDLLTDANQAWDPSTARAMAQAMEEFRVGWLEEPMRADVPWSEWQALAQATRVPLAGGENLAGMPAFERAFEARALRVVQPDVAKWGGLSGCLPLARRIREVGLRYCPHFLGGGIGLLASAHLLAAAGGDGMLEIDSNPNRLRTTTCGAAAHVVDGRVKLDERPGLGAAPCLAQLEPYRVMP